MFGELAVNSNTPIFSVVEFSRVSPNFMYPECFLSLQHVLRNAFCFCVGLILLFTQYLTETQHNRTHLEYAFENDK